MRRYDILYKASVEFLLWIRNSVL